MPAIKILNVRRKIVKRNDGDGDGDGDVLDDVGAGTKIANK